MLTAEQKCHYETFGYLHLKQVLTQDEIETIQQESNRIFNQKRGDVSFDGQKRQAVIPFFEYSPTLMRFIEDDRIYLIGQDLLGENIILNATEGNLHVGNTEWHGAIDPPGTVAAVKIAIYLEANTKDTGALRVIPGTHKYEFGMLMEPMHQQHENPSQMPFGVLGPDMPCVVLETQPGDLVVFPERLWHAAFGGRAGRPQHAVNYQAYPASDEQVAELCHMYEGFNYSLHPATTLINNDSPRLRSLVEPLVKLGFEPWEI